MAAIFKRSLPILGSSLRPYTLIPHFYKVCGCRVSSVAATGHPHTQLHRQLVDSRSIRADGGSTSRCCSRSHESVRLNAKKSVLSPALRTTYLGVVWDSTTMQARTSPGSVGSCVQCDTSWPAAHETPTGVAQDQGFFPERKPASHDQGHAVVPMCLRHVETTLVLLSWPSAGSSLSPRNASDGRVPHRLGSRHPVEAGAEARGMDASPQGGEADLESVWPGTGGPLRRNVPSGTL